jgi:serine/threonine-protein kinase
LRAAATSVGLVLAAAAGWAASERSTPERTVQAAAPAPAVVAAPETAIGCRVRYHVRRDSGTRFDAAVTVTNTGTAPIGTWDLEFALRGDQRIVSVRSGDVDQSGRTVVVRPSAAVALPAGESANLVLSGRYTESNRLPTTFLVDGRRCTASVSTVAVDPAPSGGEGTVSAAGPAEPAPRRNRAGRPSVRPSPDDADRPRTEPPTGGTAAAADDTARPRGPARPKANRSPGGKGSAGRPTMI